MEALDDRKDWVVLGLVARPHGVRGQVRVRWYSSPDELSKPITQVRLRRADKHLDCAFVLERRLDGDAALVRLGGLDTPEDVVAWRGAQILVPRALVPPAGKGELYLFELLGRAVRDVDGRKLGRAAHLYDYGAGPVLGIAPLPAPAAAAQRAVEPTPDEAAARAQGCIEATRPRRGPRRRKPRAAAAEEFLLPLLPGVLRDVQADGDVLVDSRAAGLEGGP